MIKRTVERPIFCRMMISRLSEIIDDDIYDIKIDYYDVRISSVTKR